MKSNDKLTFDNSLQEALKLFRPSSGGSSTAGLELLAKALHCEWATYWIVGLTTSRLVPKTMWVSPNVTADKLLLDTERRTLAMSEGVAGHVWKSKKAFWSNDLEMDMCLPRSLHAHSAGFKSGVWFPVMANLDVYGVIELLGYDLPQVDQDLLERLEKFGADLGIAVTASPRK